MLAFSTMMIWHGDRRLAADAGARARPARRRALGYTLTAIGYCAFVVGVPAFFASATLRAAAREGARSRAAHRAADPGQHAAQPVRRVDDARAAHADPRRAGPRRRDRGRRLRPGHRQAEGGVRVDQAQRADPARRSSTTCSTWRAPRPARSRRARAPVDIAALVERVTASVSWMVGTKQHRSSTPTSRPTCRSCSPTIAGSRTCWSTWSSNAVKFTPEGGRVIVRAYDAPSRRRRARGRSTPASASRARSASAIFEPFRQGEQRRREGLRRRRPRPRAGRAAHRSARRARSSSTPRSARARRSA